MTPIVYVIQAGDNGPVKIGASTLEGLDKRIVQMQTGNPQPLLIRALYLATDERSEARVHMRLNYLRFSGEWFQPAVIDRLDTIDLEALPFDENAQARTLAMHQLRRRHIDIASRSGDTP